MRPRLNVLFQDLNQFLAGFQIACLYTNIINVDITWITATDSTVAGSVCTSDAVTLVFIAFDALIYSHWVFGFHFIKPVKLSSQRHRHSSTLVSLKTKSSSLQTPPFSQQSAFGPSSQHKTESGSHECAVKWMMRAANPPIIPDNQIFKILCFNL